MTFLIRELNHQDFEQWRGLWQKYLSFYETTLAENIYTSTFTKLVDKKIKSQNAFVAVKSEKLIGLVHFIFHKDNWKLEDTTYLQDLYTFPEFRGMGVGKQLIKAVYKAADVNNSPSVYWQTAESNKPARILYDKISSLTPFIVYER